MILLVDARDESEAAAVSRTFETELRREPAVAEAVELLQGGPPAGIEEALWNAYMPRRFGFLAASPDEAKERLTDDGLAAAVALLKKRLGTPMSGLISRVAPRDPFLVLPGLFDGMQAAGSLGVVQERFVVTGEPAAVLFLTTRANSSNSAAQRPLLAAVSAAFARVQQQHGGHLRLSESGVNRHAIAAEDGMREDIFRVSVGSTTGLVLLFLLLFRSLRPPFMCLPVLGTGFLGGTAACLLAFGEVHGLTLAFGASLLGVAIDYSLHFHTHQALAPDPAGPRGTLRHIQGSLLLSAATTVLAFVALLAGSFPGLRQLALFAACGISTALLATWLLLPGFAGNLRPTRVLRAVSAGLERALGDGSARRWLLLPGIAALAVIALGMPRVQWDDGIGGLNRADEALRAEDQAVQARVARFEQRRVVIATGATEQEALAVNDLVAAELDLARAAGELGGYSGVARLLPSAARQRTVDAAVRADPTLWPRLRKELTDAGFVAAAFEPFANDLAAPPPEPIVPADLAGTPLEALVRPFRATGPDGPIVLTFLRDLRDEPALRQRLASIDGAWMIDVEKSLTGALGAYRERMIELLLLGLGGVVLLVWLRHRAVRPTLVAVVPALLAAGATVSILALCAAPLNLLSLVALLMVVSMGVDYGIFLAAPEQDAKARAATHLSVLLASLTTTLGFGLLAFSDQPALFSIGATSGLGIISCLLLSLSFGALAGGRR
jgi:predicted exporter